MPKIGTIEYGKSPNELKRQQRQDRLHYMLWRYDRDGWTSTLMLRARFFGTGAMCALWTAQAASRAFGLPSKWAIGLACAVLVLFAGIWLKFEIDKEDQQVGIRNFRSHSSASLFSIDSIMFLFLSYSSHL